MIIVIFHSSNNQKVKLYTYCHLIGENRISGNESAVNPYRDIGMFLFKLINYQQGLPLHIRIKIIINLCI